MSEPTWIFVTDSGSGRTAALRTDLIAGFVPRAKSATRVMMLGDLDPVFVTESVDELVAMLRPADSLCPQCGGTGQEIVAGVFAECSTCGGDGTVRT